MSKSRIVTMQNVADPATLSRVNMTIYHFNISFRYLYLRIKRRETTRNIFSSSKCSPLLMMVIITFNYSIFVIGKTGYVNEYLFF